MTICCFMEGYVLEYFLAGTGCQVTSRDSKKLLVLANLTLCQTTLCQPQRI